MSSLRAHPPSGHGVPRTKPPPPPPHAYCGTWAPPGRASDLDERARNEEIKNPSVAVAPGRQHEWAGGHRSRMRIEDLLASRAEKFVFGAIGMLVDNAVAQLAGSLRIFSARMVAPTRSLSAHAHAGVETPRDVGAALCFVDDGRGFSVNEARHIMVAHSGGASAQAPAMPPSTAVLQYGNRLCMGAMRVGADALLLTKHVTGVVSCMLMSQTLHNYVAGDQPPRAPMASWTCDGHPLGPDIDIHRSNVLAILRFSPFSTSAELLASRAARLRSGTLTIAGVPAQCQL